MIKRVYGWWAIVSLLLLAPAPAAVASPAVGRGGVAPDAAVTHPCARMPTSRLDKRASPYLEAIDGYAAKYKVDSAVIKAVIAIESCYNHRAESPKGAQGLMQLIPETAERFGVSDSFDTTQNIHGGTRYLSWLSKRYDGDLVKVLAAYNAGEGRVDQYGGIPPFRETQHYVHNVMAVYRQLSANATDKLGTDASTGINPVLPPAAVRVVKAVLNAGTIQGGPPTKAAPVVRPASAVRPAADGKPAPAKRVSAVYQSPVKRAAPAKPGRAGWQANKARAPQLYKR